MSIIDVHVAAGTTLTDPFACGVGAAAAEGGAVGKVLITLGTAERPWAFR